MTGKKINITENRAVLHTALRAKADEEVFVDGKNVVPEVYEVREHIREFSERVRSGEFVVGTVSPSPTLGLHGQTPHLGDLDRHRRQLPGSRVRLRGASQRPHRAQSGRRPRSALRGERGSSGHRSER